MRPSKIRPRSPDSSRVSSPEAERQVARASATLLYILRIKATTTVRCRCADLKRSGLSEPEWRDD